MAQLVALSAVVPVECTGQRLDQTLAQLFDDYSRMRIKQWIEAGCVLVNDEVITAPRTKVIGGQLLQIDAVLEDDNRFVAQNIELNIVYEDDDLLVLNKPAGLVVHPGAGNREGTVLNALLHHAPSIAEVPRAGIVHRLDKDTTGLMVVAKTVPAQTALVKALQQRDITREYEAITMGVLTGGGTVDAPIGRHPTQRVKMAVVADGKPAVTHYRVMDRYIHHTRIRLRLETGRTHQIRVHMAHIGYPLVGDPVYAGRFGLPAKINEELRAALRGFKRQALHATRLAFAHPITGAPLQFDAPLPQDMVDLIAVLEQFRDDC